MSTVLFPFCFFLTNQSNVLNIYNGLGRGGEGQIEQQLLVGRSYVLEACTNGVEKVQKPHIHTLSSIVEICCPNTGYGLSILGSRSC